MLRACDYQKKNCLSSSIQAAPETFNKASLMNGGYLEVKKLFDFDCVVFHDVDMIPEDDRNFYSCINSPLHLGAYIDKFKYK